MPPLHRMLAVSVLSLPLIAAGAIPASAGNSQGNANQNGQGTNSQSAGAPELDPGLLVGAVTLLAGCLLVLRESRRD